MFCFRGQHIAAACICQWSVRAPGSAVAASKRASESHGVNVLGLHACLLAGLLVWCIIHQLKCNRWLLCTKWLGHRYAALWCFSAYIQATCLLACKPRFAVLVNTVAGYFCAQSPPGTHVSFHLPGISPGQATADPLLLTKHRGHALTCVDRGVCVGLMLIAGFLDGSMPTQVYCVPPVALVHMFNAWFVWVHTVFPASVVFLCSLQRAAFATCVDTGVVISARHCQLVVFAASVACQ